MAVMAGYATRTLVGGVDGGDGGEGGGTGGGCGEGGTGGIEGGMDGGVVGDAGRECSLLAASTKPRSSSSAAGELACGRMVGGGGGSVPDNDNVCAAAGDRLGASSGVATSGSPELAVAATSPRLRVGATSGSPSRVGSALVFAAWPEECGASITSGVDWVELAGCSGCGACSCLNIEEPSKPRASVAACVELIDWSGCGLGSCCLNMEEPSKPRQKKTAPKPSRMYLV